MNFNALLSYLREKSNLTKRQLAERLGIGETYVGHLEAGRSKPPIIERCHAIASALSLSKSETQQLIDAAMEERLSQEALEWLQSRESRYQKTKEICTDEILEALTDPVAVKALLATYKSQDDIKRIVAEIVENFHNISKERRREILKLCHG